MTTHACVAAFAVEDWVDFWFSDGTKKFEYSRIIPENEDFLVSLRALMARCLEDLIQNNFKGRARELFNSLDAITISIPGVIEDNQVLLQIPLWNIPSLPPIIKTKTNGRVVDGFDFRDELTTIVDKIIKQDGDKLGHLERTRFARRVFVVNDATACAAFEFVNRVRSRETSDFIYVKVHNGINVGVVEKTDAGHFEIKTQQPEAGHTIPSFHELDGKFEGVCPFHKGCLEGMVAGHSMLRRAQGASTGVFSEWGDVLALVPRIEIETHRPFQKLQGIERNFVHAVLGDGKLPEDLTPAEHALVQRVVAEAVDVVAFYVSQLVHSLSIGPMTPSHIIIGGRFAKPRVLKAIREHVVARANGYPRRRNLSAEGIITHIVQAQYDPEDRSKIDIHGAWEIAKARASLAPDWDGNRVPLLEPASAKVIPFRGRPS